MSREIKFRAWLQGKHGSIDFGADGFMDESPTIQDGKYAYVESGWDIQGLYDSIPLMQFTGLKDKNGKEIYEEDIVELKYHPQRSAVRAVIEYIEDESRFSPVSIRNETYFGFEDAHYNTLVVIGNIYEKPELLEEKQ